MTHPLKKTIATKSVIQSSAVVLTTVLTGLPAMAAPPTFDAGALLEQLNRQSATQPVGKQPSAAPQSRELLTGFELRELPERLVPVATDFLKPYVGKEVNMNSLMLALYMHLQGRNPRDNYIFTAKKVGANHVLIAQKVLFDGVTLENNGTRSSNDFLTQVMGYNLVPQTALDFSQIERNATILREMPGIVSQFTLKPGASPGSSNMHLSADQAATWGGSVTEDNSSTRGLGEWATRADVAAYNHFGRADILRISGQATLRSQSLGLDASATIHPSGLRSGINLSTFHYGYKSNAVGTAEGNPQSTSSHYTGVSNSAGLNFTYPRLRSDETRQNLTLDLNYNTSVSDVDINQQTSLLGTTPLQVNNTSASYQLSDLLIRKATLGVNQTQAVSTGATVSYQLAVVTGNATQRLNAVAIQDKSSENTLGQFAKATAAVQYSQSFTLGGLNLDGLLSGDVQFTHRNLAGPEKSYLGGIYKMQGWGPQAVGAQQVAYLKAQATRPLASKPGMAVGVFAEIATLQMSTRNYNANVGTQTVPINTGWQTLSDVGVMLTHTPRANISVSAAVAKKLTKDPFVNGSRIQEDGTVRGWLSVRISF